MAQRCVIRTTQPHPPPRTACGRQLQQQQRRDPFSRQGDDALCPRSSLHELHGSHSCNVRRPWCNGATQRSTYITWVMSCEPSQIQPIACRPRNGSRSMRRTCLARHSHVRYTTLLGGKSTNMQRTHKHYRCIALYLDTHHLRRCAAGERRRCIHRYTVATSPPIFRNRGKKNKLRTPCMH
jgi:hypothetical protein